MIIRRSVLLFVCCYMFLFCALKNLNDSFQNQWGILDPLTSADGKSVDIMKDESVKFHRHLAGIWNNAGVNESDDIIKKVVDTMEKTTIGSVLVDPKLEVVNLTECRLPKEQISLNELKVQNENKLRTLLNNCDKFVKDHGYLDFPVATEEKEFPLAFAIKMHQNPGQVEQLLRTIYRPHNVYCVHVDKKTDNGTFEIMKKIGNCLSNVVIVKERERVVYASFGLVKAELKCMQIMLSSKINWKYYINMAGQEFPLRTNLEMVKILKDMKGANDIETYNHPVFLDWRIRKRYTVTGNSLSETGNKAAMPYKINISKGSAYGLFTRNFVDFILSDRIAKEVVRYFNDTFAPEENVWATLNTLPWAPGGYSMEVRHLLSTFLSRAVIWSGDSPRCHGNFVRGICVFKSRDFQWLVKRPQFFANKFDHSVDANILNCMESWYKARAHSGATLLDWKYYLKQPHVKHYRNLLESRKSKNYLLTLKRKWKKEHDVS